jgi:predicted dehydrogenase
MNMRTRGGKLKAAIIGLGRIGSILEDDPLREKPCTHAGAVAANPGIILAGGCDTDPERRRLFRERWGCAAVYADAGELLEKTRPDILHIATHPDSHFFYTRLAADHRVKVVVCEKPLADTVAAARRIAKLHRSGAVKIITNHERRYSNDYIQALSLIENGSYGKLLSIGAKLYFGKTRRPMDQMVHDGTHLVDMINYLSRGRLRKTAVQGNLNSRTGTAFVAGICRPGGIPVLVETGAGRDHLTFELDLSFERGRLRIGNGLYEQYESRESPYYTGFRSLLPGDTADFAATGYFANMVKDAAACARDPLRRPVSSALDGLAALEFILSLKK